MKRCLYSQSSGTEIVCTQVAVTKEIAVKRHHLQGIIVGLTCMYVKIQTFSAIENER